MRHKVDIDGILKNLDSELNAKERALLFRRGEDLQLLLFDIMAVVQIPMKFTKDDAIYILNTMVDYDLELKKYFQKLREYVNGEMIEWATIIPQKI